MADLIVQGEIDFGEPRNTPTINADGIVRWRIIDKEIHFVFYKDELSGAGNVEHNISGRLSIKLDPTKNAALLIARDAMEALR